ncbi:hypothetical protein AM499_06335 [Bacillus sp. FJAT-22090]|uniref:hypothetical protein n=1 Tax=Bacillus sp. FJAT-22090 TaxID=1581038 RepID=UPI0006ADDC12|nr:hypothetical protein [Bacillus sp. FJAT-22090]ALC85472.1 hypothetical protein AM499_06335 [Bacillus sp. FJAT-22090]
MCKIDKFTKWFIASFILGIVGLIAVFFVEDIARITGEMNRSILLIGTITIFILILSSLFSIVKANSNRIKRELVISVFFAIIPLSALVINGLIFTVYFVGK